MTRTTAALLAGACGCAGALGLAGSAAAEPVPAGPITFVATDGQMKAGRFAPFTLVTPASPATIRGTVAADGTVTVPTTGFSLPSSSLVVTQPIQATVTLAFTPTAPARGRIDRATGALTTPLRATVDVTISALQQTCTISGAQLDLGTGTVQVPSQAEPAPPATVPFSGTPLSAGGGFAVAGLSTAPLPPSQPASSPVCAFVNEQIGLPAVVGVRLAGQLSSATPRLSAGLAPPRTTKRGRTVTLRVTLVNRGTADATGVRMRTSLPKGVTGPRRVSVGTIAAGKRRTVSVKLRTTSRAALRSRVGVIVGGDGIASRTFRRTLKLR